MCYLNIMWCEIPARFESHRTTHSNHSQYRLMLRIFYSLSELFGLRPSIHWAFLSFEFFYEIIFSCKIENNNGISSKKAKEKKRTCWKQKRMCRDEGPKRNRQQGLRSALLIFVGCRLQHGRLHARAILHVVSCLDATDTNSYTFRHSCSCTMPWGVAVPD